MITGDPVVHVIDDDDAARDLRSCSEQLGFAHALMSSR